MDFIVKHIDTILTVLTAVIFPILGFIFFKLYRRPRLEIGIHFRNGNRKRGRPSNYPQNTSGGIPRADELDYYYEFRQDFEIRILNNSDIDGYDIEVFVAEINNSDFHVQGNQKHSPLLAHEEFVIPCRYNTSIESSYGKPPEIRELRSNIRKEIEVILSVKNKFRFKRFYSKYSNGENKFKLLKPKIAT
ncbi:MAG TPA: hypothetical protein DEO59_17800 [Balneola sp.]|jgi:hypothetical protein|nr:hypothetical protein [Balneola sp.]MAO78117.1 hypothetical protein [Balneola sp.]MBF64118.1 hypothetical protein [Balneola sp.]HAW82269.1 hypothetical protein [Balneola sp.]HBZ40236.1 hypothetical protein [Balneola sp.]|tara:strand:+ start:4927 stop:5496 length:570 start_codon:yes stop_codon:yes gene_type:complete